MIRFDGYNIELTSGDTLFFNVNLAGRVLPEGSVAYFTVKENPKSEANVIRKKIDVIDGSIDIRLSSEVTYLPARTYYWDIRVLIPIDSGGYEVETPMEYAAFTIVDAIGFPGDDGQPPGLDENLPRLSLLIEEAREVIDELKDYQIPDEQIEQIVRDYLEENPPEAGVDQEAVDKSVAEAINQLPEWSRAETKPSYTASEVGALPESTKIPSKTSDLTNNSGFITKAVSDLTNYYLKSETYTQAEINQRISAIPKFSISVVNALPTSGISETTIYLVKSGSDSDLYTEYIRVNGAWEILGSQRVDLTGYATETWVVVQLAGYQPKGDYLLPSELQPAVDDALAQAKASGAFDGKPGTSGKDGGYYTPVMEGTVLKGWNPSNDDMFVIEQNIDLGGKDGVAGKDGGYYTPQMNGTVLTGWKPSNDSMVEIMQSVDLRGPAGPQGEKGETGAQGPQGEKGDTGSQGPQGETGPAGAAGAKGDKGDKGDTGAQGPQGEKGDTGSAGADGVDGVGISSVKQTTTSSADGGSNVVTVTLTNGQTSTFTVKNGSKGSTGAAGAAGSNGADGYTPVRGTDYWTAEDKASIAADVLAILDASADAHVVVDTDNNITLSGVADGEYTLKFNNADGSTTTICTLTVSDGNGEGSGGGTDEPDVPAYTNLVPTSLAHTDLSTIYNGTGYKDGAYASSSPPYVGSDAATVCTGAIPAAADSVFYIKGVTLDASANPHCRVGFAQAHATNGGLSVGAVKLVNQLSGHATLEVLGDQYYKLTLDAAYMTSSFTNQAYIFLSGIGTGENLIVTANEPIV